MSAQPGVRLRELARRYAEGQLSRVDYVSMRTRLLDGTTGQWETSTQDSDPGEETTVVGGEPPPVLEGRISLGTARGAALPGQGAGERPAARTDDEAGPSDSTLPGIRRALMWGAVGGVLIAGLTMAVWFSSLEREPAGGVATEPVGQPAVSVPRSLVEDFLAQEDWSPPAIADFLAAWNGLPASDRSGALGAAWFKTLVDELNERISEQEALSDIRADGTASDAQRTLLDFAVGLGLRKAVVPTRERQRTTVPVDPQVGQTPPGDSAASSREREHGSGPGSRGHPSEVHASAAVMPGQNTGPEPGGTGLPAGKGTQRPSAGGPAPDRPAEAAWSPSDEATMHRKDTGSLDSARAPDTARVDAGAEDTKRNACRAALAQTRRPHCRDPLPDGGEGPLMVVLPRGEFVMGSERADEEQPAHRVTIPRAFAISVYEIAHGDYALFCRATGYRCPEVVWDGGDYPVVNVSWHDARAYAQWLSQASGARYRLPSEAEWEYAARGGTTTPYPFGEKVLPSDARFAATAPLPNTQRLVNRNRFRLYHVAGNVREWVEDSWHPTHLHAPQDTRPRLRDTTGQRVVRGGSYADGPERLRSAARESLPASGRDGFTGFRLVREVGRKRNIERYDVTRE